VYFFDEAGALGSLPAEWTDIQGSDIARAVFVCPFSELTCVFVVGFGCFPAFLATHRTGSSAQQTSHILSSARVLRADERMWGYNALGTHFEQVLT